jgi:hypothetical protein
MLDELLLRCSSYNFGNKFYRLRLSCRYYMTQLLIVAFWYWLTSTSNYL